MSCSGWDQVNQNMDEITEWVKSDEDRSRPRRVRRHRELLELLPMPPESLSFPGGDESVICLDEIRLCYVQGLDLAVVLLCLAYVEREVAANLYAAGWNGASKATLPQLLDRGFDDGLLAFTECKTIRGLADVRNSYAHFRVPGDRSSLMHRAVEENSFGTEVLAKDAKRAVGVIAGLVRRQAGFRVGLGPSEG